MIPLNDIFKKLEEIPITAAKEEAIKLLKIAYIEAEKEINDLIEKNAQLRQEFCYTYYTLISY
jgi:hypothetical protein